MFRELEIHTERFFNYVRLDLSTYRTHSGVTPFSTATYFARRKNFSHF